MNTLHVNVHYLPLPILYQPREQRREGSPSSPLVVQPRERRRASPLLFSHVSRFEMKCIVVSDLLGTNILLDCSVLSARIG